MRFCCILSTIVLAGCLRDDGIVNPTDRNEPLASFVGSGVGDKTSDPGVDHLDRLVQLRNPRIALVWQFLGPKEYVRAPSSAVVEADWPYEFKADLWDPPAPEVLDNPDLAIAQFWLYADRNDNGNLDRLVHPDMEPVNAFVDSIYRAYHDALADLAAESEVREPVETRETYYLAGAGFDYGGDTLRFRVADGNLEALVPGLCALPLRARDSSTLFSTGLKLDLSADFDTAGLPIGLKVGLDGRHAYAPAFGHEPPDARTLFPGLPDSLPDTVAREEGSARDLQPTLDGKRNYAYSGDSTFLKSGDGWVAGMRASKAEFAMGQGGDHLLLRLPGLKGKAASETFTFHPERGAGRRRVRLSFLGGASAERQDRMLAGEVWIAFDGKPVQATWGPFPVPDDEYHVRLEQVPTADAAVGYAVGSYSVQTD